MFRRISYLILITALTAGLAHAQLTGSAPGEKDMYCSGVVTTQSIPRDTYVISGVESDDVLVFKRGDLVFLNKGTEQGVKVGDEFLVSRPVTEQVQVKWFAWQNTLAKAMGTTYEDEGRVRVVNVQPKTSTAQIVFSCSYMQRGDIAQPFVARTAPPYRTDVKFDQFAPPSGKGKAMIVTTRSFGQLAGTGATVYVNLGSGQGVKVGDYFRVFRYQGGEHETTFQNKDTAFKMYGMGSTPVPYTPSELPRDVLGEGIVLRVGVNASTVLITTSQREIHVGDYVEIE
jgi:hypothetical protein